LKSYGHWKKYRSSLKVRVSGVTGCARRRLQPRGSFCGSDRGCPPAANPALAAGWAHHIQRRPSVGGRNPEDVACLREFLRRAVRNQKELVGNDRTFVLDGIFFWNAKMNEADRDC
jgi:hypothetical protein